MAVALIAILVAAASPALATFPGANGHIAYLSTVPRASGCAPFYNAIFLTDLGQLTPAPSNDCSIGVGDFGASFAWSPDGSQLAFIDATGTTLEIIGRDGNGLHPLISDSQQYFSGYGPTAHTLRSLAWSRDGNSIAFVVTNVPVNNNGLFSLRTDGTGLQQLIDGYLYLEPDQLDSSSQGDLVFTCEPPDFALPGLCVLSNGSINKLRLANARFPKWTPDGQKILFNLGGQIFRATKDLTELTQITHPESVLACPPFTNTAPSRNYGALSPSPDGKWIAAWAGDPVFTADCLFKDARNAGVWVMDMDGGSQTLLAPGGTTPAWQPIPQALTFNILDGHNNPLKGMKVELRRTDDTVIDGGPINTVGGSYVFEDGLLPGADYIIRATMVDKCGLNCTPAFDIRYAPGVDEPVVSEWHFTATAIQPPPYTLNIDATDPFLVYGTSPDQLKLDRLDDMANIYFRMRQYVDWIKNHLTPSQSPTVPIYTFAALNSDRPLAQYSPAPTPKIEIDEVKSDYSERDAIAPRNGASGPENDEWHEFTHHLYQTWIHDIACPGDTNHAGYDNLDTCDSMSEGFAVFLPTLAARDILGSQAALLTDQNGQPVIVALSTSLYDSLWDLTFPTNAWGSRCCDINGNLFSAEDFAVPTLLWDLVARNGDTEVSGVIGANGVPHVVTYTNPGPNISIQQLWTSLTTAHPGTVFDLRSAFGNAPLTIDLDGDGIPDVAPIDIPFLMHGFYPIDTDQTQFSHTTNFYDVGYSQRLGGGVPRDGFVGYTSHHRYNVAGTEVLPARIPRYDIPPSPHANIALTVLDSTGAPVSKATAILTIDYPGGQSKMARPLGSASPTLVHLELPAYFDYLLPANAPLPACDPLRDVQVNVTITVVKNGHPSNETPSFNNCTYLHAVAAATGPAALSFTVTIPIVVGSDTTPPTTTAAISPQPNAAGWTNSNVTVTLTAADNQDGSGVQQITYSSSGAQNIPNTVTQGASATVIISGDGQTTLTFYATDNAGNSESSQQVVISIDKTAPSVQCGRADGLWHARDISITCVANDSLSGLANTSDSSFALTTAVPIGTEKPNASTGSRSICDVAGNCRLAGPIGGNMIDEKPPTISISAPTSGTYFLNQALVASYACADGGSGVASCAGPVTSGSSISTSLIGGNTFGVNATDNVGNVATQSVTYTVVYKICILYDPTRSVQSGSTIPIKLELCDANNANVSNSSTTLHAVSLVQMSTNASEIIQAAGNANPDNDFRYDGGGQPAAYMFNLSTKGLSTGSYVLSFTAGADATTYRVMFQVR